MITEADVDTVVPVMANFDPADPGLYVYLPEKGYIGKDKAVMLVEIGGVKVKVIYFFQAVDGPTGDVPGLCGKKGYSWKISTTLNPDGTSTVTAVDPLPSLTDSAPITGATLASVLGKGLASSLDANTTGITFAIADLPGGAVGQTTGTSHHPRHQCGGVRLVC